MNVIFFLQKCHSLSGGRCWWLVGESMVVEYNANINMQITFSSNEMKKSRQKQDIHAGGTTSSIMSDEKQVRKKYAWHADGEKMSEKVTGWLVDSWNCDEKKMICE